MEIKDAIFYKRFRANEVSPEELKNYLVHNYTVFQLADELASYLIEDNLCENNKIILSPAQEQLVKVMFSRIARTRYLGKGRKPKNADTLAEREGINESLLIK